MIGQSEQLRSIRLTNVFGISMIGQSEQLRSMMITYTILRVVNLLLGII